ncbi:hypothetical protein A6770_35720 [Nostoc minutum NIES-26]|uniref:Uncharacterized protein n=1 Tax=Nostoc minutum NIES-26 TaxID=1844469 RepID=A0A367RZJ6_9NOSO|nr:hypothetical protein A6770_35720 [Nostoc minutum NIES-26]
MCQQKEGAHKEVSPNCSSIETPVRNRDEARNLSGYVADSNLRYSQVSDRPLEFSALRDRSQIKIRKCNHVMQV